MTKPKKKRRRKDGSATVEVSASTAAVLYDGQVDLSGWDDAELLQGRRRSKDGKFRGRRPQLVPAEMMRELVKRRFSRAYEKMSGNLAEASDFLMAIIRDPMALDSDRLRAIEILFDRILGKPKESISLGVGIAPTPEDKAPWKRIIATAIVGTAQEAERLLAQNPEQPIEGEVIDVTPTPTNTDTDTQYVDDVTGETWRFLDSRTPQRSRS